MAGYLLGRFYFVLPLAGMFYGLMVMIHRKWPSNWNSRYTGGVLLLLSMCLMSTISAMQQKLGPLGMLHPGNVLAQIHNDLSGALSPGAGDSSVYMLGKDISGGYTGALAYAALLWLFGNLGAKLLMIVLLAISFMLITNLSYVELFTLLRVRAVKLVEGIKLRAANRPAAVPVVSRPRRTNRSAAPEPDDDEDYIEEASDSGQQLPSRGRPNLLSRVSGWFSGNAAARNDHQPELDDEETAVPDIIITDPAAVRSSPGLQQATICRRRTSMKRTSRMRIWSL